jgi:hypothetical protein
VRLALPASRPFAPEAAEISSLPKSLPLTIILMFLTGWLRSVILTERLAVAALVVAASVCRAISGGIKDAACWMVTLDLEAGSGLP